MGSAPAGAQCPLTSSLGEFPGYKDWLWYSGLSPVLVSIAIPFAFHISVFSIHSSSLTIGFHSFIFNGDGICTPPPTILLYLGLDQHMATGDHEAELYAITNCYVLYLRKVIVKCNVITIIICHSKATIKKSHNHILDYY